MGRVKLNIPMFAALILLLLTMVTTHMTSGLYARYTASATGSDSARVAKFDVIVSEGVFNNGDGTYTFTVTNNSEVTVGYSIVVQMHPKLTATVGAETKKTDSWDNPVTFENDGWKLAPGAVAQDLTVTFAPDSWRGLTDPNTNNGAQETVELEFAVSVTAEQID